MDLREEVTQLRQTGAERAATLWEMLEALPEPIAAVDIYKAACSIKCAEFLSRIRNNSVYLEITKLLAGFVDETITIIGDGSGDRIGGFRVIDLIEREMPLTKEIYEDAAAYATRQHVYDALILLAAAKLGKAEETKDAIDHLQKGIARVMVMAIVRASVIDMREMSEDETEI